MQVYPNVVFMLQTLNCFKTCRHGTPKRRQSGKANFQLLEEPVGRANSARKFCKTHRKSLVGTGWYRMVQARWGKVSNIFWWPKSIFHYNYDKIKGTNHICIGLRNSLGMHAQGLGLCICFLTIFRVLHKINLTKCPFFFPFCEMEKNPTLEKQLVWLMLYFYLFIQQCPWNAFGALFTQKMWSSNVFGAFFSQECTWCGTWFCYVFLSHVPCPGDYCIHLIRCSSPWPSKCGWVTGLNLKPGSPVNGQGEVGGSGSAQVLPKISPEHIYIY